MDGDGIGYRSVPGTPSPWSGFFTRGTGHDEYGRYSEHPDAWERNLDRIKRKFETARRMVPAPEVQYGLDARIGLISLGSNHPAIEEARDRLAETGVETDYLRVRALPVNRTVRDFIADHELNIVIENNADGQLHGILKGEVDVPNRQLVSACKCNGLPLPARWIVTAVLDLAAN